VDDGEAVMLVKDIGLNTFYGKLALELSEKGKSACKTRRRGSARKWQLLEFFF
jgi:hypothetical protein